MDLTLPAFALAWFTLSCGPILTVVVARGQLGGGQSLQRLCVRAAILLLSVAVCWSIDLEFAWRLLNWIALAAAYLAWCTLMGALFRLPPRALGLALGTLGSVSLIPGLVLTTVGILGLMFFVGDYAAPPAKLVRLPSGLDCVVTKWGNATTDDGHDVHLYRYISWLPVLRRQVRRLIVNETYPTRDVPRTTDCDTFKRMELGKRTTAPLPHIAASMSFSGTNANPIELSAMPYGKNSWSPCRIAPQE